MQPIERPFSVYIIRFYNASTNQNEYLIKGSACDGQAQTIDLSYTTNGSIYSPGYPNNYGNNENCQWIIKAPYGERILIYFTTFDLEDHSQCSFDSVNIFDGQNSNASLLSKRCGSSLPQPVNSSGRYIYMQFTSDGSVTKKGFVAHYRTLSSGRLYKYVTNRSRLLNPKQTKKEKHKAYYTGICMFNL